MNGVGHLDFAGDAVTSMRGWRDFTVSPPEIVKINFLMPITPANHRAALMPTRMVKAHERCWLNRVQASSMASAIPDDGLGMIVLPGVGTPPTTM